VTEVKQLLGAGKAGHTGTLDPLATGVLPICLNEATKLVPFLGEDTKTYLATMRLGITTDTLDREGIIIEQREHCTDRRLIEETMRRFIGVCQQVPPRYSAAKYRGKALYKWARQGVSVSAAPKTVQIINIAVESISPPDVTFTVTCSKGTYIRVLCADVGEMMGCGACLVNLRRIRSGIFYEDAAINLNSLAPADRRLALASRIVSMVDALAGMAAVEVEVDLARRIREGYQPGSEILNLRDKPFIATGDMIKLTLQGALVAIAKLSSNSRQIEQRHTPQALRILRVFHE
jgi:tRNA pseudouridine55 synthase